MGQSLLRCNFGTSANSSARMLCCRSIDQKLGTNCSQSTVETQVVVIISKPFYIPYRLTNIHVKKVRNKSKVCLWQKMEGKEIVDRKTKEKETGKESRSWVSRLPPRKENKRKGNKPDREVRLSKKKEPMPGNIYKEYSKWEKKPN